MEKDIHNNPDLDDDMWEKRLIEILTEMIVC